MADGKPRGALSEPGAEPLLVAAANGEVQAYRDLITLALNAHRDGHVSFVHALWGVEMIARIAAAKGEEYDRLTLAALLFHMAQVEVEGGGSWAPIYQAEAVAILNDLSDESSEAAAEMLTQVADGVTAEVLQLAGEMEREALLSQIPQTKH